ncbi:MAG: aspartate aminotransferase family protein [Bacteroidales bacterium]|nr:aspartate aminotransferase family protein [Bacteroidales bacterium]
MFTLRDLFFKHVAQTSNNSLSFTVSFAKNEFIYDQNNNPYLDCISGIAVSNVGHNNPYVVNAIKKQADLFLHTMVYGEHIQQPQVLLAKKLSDLTHNQLHQVYFLNSGAEAVDAAIKLARKFTNRKQIIACRNSYHGSTIGAMSLMSNYEYYSAYGPFLQDIDFIEFNNIDSLNKITQQTAAVIIELIQGEAGYIPIQNEFLIALHETCKIHHCLLIFDEIQTGIGRTGKFFAFEHFNIVPDVLLLAKALGGGLPLSAIMAKEHVLSAFKDNPPLGHLTTFGGNPLSCAASLAAIEFIETHDILKNVQDKEKLFFKLLANHSDKKIRGLGLMLAIQLNSDTTVQKIIAYCFEKGLLLDWFLFNPSAIRIAPPLTINTEQITFLCQILNEALNLHGY